MEYFPSLASAPVYWTNAGVRALVAKPGSESSVSRLHRIAEDVPGLISVLGGKITGYRAIAEQATDAICRRLGSRARAATAEAPLPGAVAAGETGSAVPAHLKQLYGSRAHGVLRIASSDRKWAAPLAPEYPDIAAQVAFAAREEACERLTDFMFRRTLLGFSPDQGRAAAPAAAALLAGELDWTAAREAAELAAYFNRVEETQITRTAAAALQHRA